MTDRSIDIEIFTHRETGLLLALSKSDPGLMAHARTREALDANIATARTALAEARAT